MKMLRTLLACAMAAAACAQVLPPPPALQPHPRLLLTPARLAALQASIAAGGDAAAIAGLLKQHADWALAQPPVPRGQAGASGVLIPVRNSMDLLLTSAAQAALEGGGHGNVYFERALVEARNLGGNWSSWNTEQHALDTGEALQAMGLAYDWLYAGLTTSERTELVGYITVQGLTPYKKYIGTSTFWWMNNTINWNCVCSAGGVTAVFAIQGDAGAPEWAWNDIAAPLVAGVGPCVGAYHADSSWEEGPSYWGYASMYNAFLFSALNNVLNSTLGLADLPGVAHAARFPLYTTGAQALTAPRSASTFNWADAGQGFVWAPFAQWWSGAFGERAAGYFARAATLAVGPGALHGFAWASFVEALAYFDPLGSAADVLALPRAVQFPYINMGVFRGPWLAAKEGQTYAGFKGGDSAWNHNHLDLGSFVYDCNGTRFAADMGADNYALPGYFDDKVRWSYYRLNSRGHNVVLLDNSSQPFPATAAITAFNASGAAPVDAAARVDLTLAYAAHARAASRTLVSLNDTRALLIVDEWSWGGGGGGAAPRNLTWQLHTAAAATVLPPPQAGVALLARDGSRALLALLPAQSACPSLAGVSVTDLAPLLPPPFDSAAGYLRIDALALAPAQGGAQCTRLAFALGEEGLVQAMADAGAAPVQLDQLFG